MKKNFVLLGAIIVLTQSCLNLKEINTFANTSDATLKTLDERNYSFTSSYIKYTISQTALGVTPQETSSNRFLPPTLKQDNAALKINQEADRVISLLANSLQAYLQGIAKLSAPDLVNYDFSKVGENLKGNSQALGLSKVSAADVDAGVKISKVLTDGIMSRYREKKLRGVMIDYNTDFQATAKALATALDALNENVRRDSAALFSRYAGVLGNPDLPMTAKLQWRQDYTSELTELIKKRTTIQRQIQAVEQLRTAHGEIASKLATNKLTSKEVIASLKQHSGELKSLFSSIQQLLK